jgi:sialic acid synthase SpsE
MMHYKDAPQCFIIGDIGSNWHNLNDCLDSIEALADAGAHFAKFQFFDYKKLYGYSDGGKIFGELQREWIPKLASHCDTHKISFLCSVFDPLDVPLLDRYCSWHKIASAEANYKDLIKAVAVTQKPTLVSTGCATEDDIKQAHRILGKQFVPMSCTMMYPAKRHPINNLLYLRKKYHGHLVAFSDHSLDMELSAWIAHSMNCVAYEKHFCLERVVGTPDEQHSFNERQFEDLVEKFAMVEGHRDVKWEFNDNPHKRRQFERGFFRKKPFC